MLSLVISIVVGLLATLLSSVLGRLLQIKELRENVGSMMSYKLNLFTREQRIAALYNVMLFGVMIGGILANYFWANGFGLPIDLNKFWKPILISPIIFLVVYVAAAKQARGLVPVLNGFSERFLLANHPRGSWTSS